MIDSLEFWLLAPLAVVFAGISKAGDVQGFVGYMEAGGVPAFLGWPVILFEILAGLAVIVGFQTRLAALGLAGFCLLSGLLYHFDPSNQMQMNSFFKNLGMGGGFLALVAAGAGRFSVEARRG